MTTFLLVAALLAGIVVLTPLADRIRVPYPVLLTLFGLAVPLVPGVPSLTVDPELILPLVLPPLLFAATQRATARDFQDNARAILVLAIGLTVTTAGIVAVVAHAMGLEWGPAFVLGAVVSPPDPVAATAVARRLRLPGRLVTVLEGEGMFNDATALVLYKVAVGAVVAGELSGGALALSLVLAVGVGIAVGLAGGALAQLALSRLHLAAPETTITLAIPFGVYLLADRLEGSGVLAVLVTGLYLRTFGHRVVTSGGWLLGRAVWRYADYIITSLVFVFIGFELTAVLENEPLGSSAVWLSLAVVGTLIATRFGWLFPAAAGARLRVRRNPDEATPVGVRETVVTGWAGMRGVVTVATALAVPASVAGGGDFPDRHLIVLVGLVVVLATLVVQGLTLAPLVRWLGVGSDVDVSDEVRRLRRRATAAALERLEQDASDAPERAREAVILQYRGYLAAQDALVTARRGDLADEADTGDQQAVDDLLRRAAEIEREVVIEARRHGEVAAEAADEVLDDVESRAVRDSG